MGLETGFFILPQELLVRMLSYRLDAVLPFIPPRPGFRRVLPRGSGQVLLLFSAFVLSPSWIQVLFWSLFSCGISAGWYFAGVSVVIFRIAFSMFGSQPFSRYSLIGSMP